MFKHTRGCKAVHNTPQFDLTFLRTLFFATGAFHKILCQWYVYYGHFRTKLLLSIYANTRY